MIDILVTIGSVSIWILVFTLVNRVSSEDKNRDKMFNDYFKNKEK